MVLALHCLKAGAATVPEEGLDFGVNERGQINNAQPESTEDDTFGLPYSQIMRDTESPYEYPFRNIWLGGLDHATVGSGNIAVQSGLRNFVGINPLGERGSRPKNAEFQIGPFYLDVENITAGLLVSDNVNWTETNRQAGVIGIVRLVSLADFQLTDNLRIAMRGALVYLPFQGKIGIAGFGIRDDVGITLNSVPLTRAQFTYNVLAGGWEIKAFDDFRARYRYFDVGMGESLYDYRGESFDEEDRAGHYVFRYY